MSLVSLAGSGVVPNYVEVPLPSDKLKRGLLGHASPPTKRPRTLADSVEGATLDRECNDSGRDAEPVDMSTPTDAPGVNPSRIADPTHRLAAAHSVGSAQPFRF